jgi:hypothetical protein
MSSIDTILGKVTNVNGVLTGVTVAPGDSLTVRNFPTPGQAFLENVIMKGATLPTARILSPYLHDTTRGITFISGQSPTVRTLSRRAPQMLTAQDTLIVQETSGAADSSAVALQVYYSDLGASDARLASWGDVAGIIQNIKPLEVDVTASATIGAWNDTAITTTENNLKANTDYAVLGYLVDVACLCVAVKGQDTGSLRIAGPGSILAHETDDYFARLSDETGRPHIPIINAANVNNTTVSVADNAASTAVKVQLILAQLSQNLSV